MHTAVSTHVALLIVSCGYTYCIYSFTVKSCDDIGTFQQRFSLSLPKCAEECFRRQRCIVFMFHFGMQHCVLKDHISLQSLGEEGSLCNYYTRDDWSQIDLGPCNGHTCSETERCTSKTDNIFECVKSECHTPGNIPNAKLLSKTHSIGATNMYKCNYGFVGQGTPTITCGGDAEWSVTDFVCFSKLTSCTVPENHYFNADLTHVEGSQYAPGTVLTFTCREGFWNKATGDEWTTTCQNSLLWEPNGIRCCPNNVSTDSTKCSTTMDGGIISSFKEANDYCENFGGKFIRTSGELKFMYNTTITQYAIQSIKISYIINTWDYQGCAAVNGVWGIDENKTLHEKIAEATNNNWKGRHCWFGTIWSPGQPNLTTTDNCIVRDLHKPYKHFSYPCFFNSSDSIGFACAFDLPRI